MTLCIHFSIQTRKVGYGSRVSCAHKIICISCDIRHAQLNLHQGCLQVKVLQCVKKLREAFKQGDFAAQVGT